MDITDEIAELRVESESMMTDICAVARNGIPTGPPFTIDPTTGLATGAAPVAVYSGPCWVSSPAVSSRVRELESAGDEVFFLVSSLSVPVSAARILVDDLVTVTASTFTPNLVGMVFRVTGLMPGSHQVAQHVQIETVTG